MAFEAAEAAALRAARAAEAAAEAARPQPSPSGQELSREGVGGVHLQV